jgi:hypothetical protein
MNCPKSHWTFLDLSELQFPAKSNNSHHLSAMVPQGSNTLSLRLHYNRNRPSYQQIYTSEPSKTTSKPWLYLAVQVDNQKWGTLSPATCWHLREYAGWLKKSAVYCIIHLPNIHFQEGNMRDWFQVLVHFQRLPELPDSRSICLS